MCESNEQPSQCYMFGELQDNSDENHNEISSDGCSTTYSDDNNPELQDYESDLFLAVSDEDSTSSRTEYIAGRMWRHTCPRDTTIEHVPRSGSLTAKSENITSIRECFELFISVDVIDIIVSYTNQKAEHICGTLLGKVWKRVDRTEIYAFLGLLLTIGRFRESRESKNDLWKKNAALSRPIYTAVMSRDRFRDILKYMRFDDLTTREERKTADKLAPLREVANIFTANCRESYNASSEGTVDEQLVTYRGRCSFKVFMPQKPGKYGIKLWMLCDSTNYYCCNLDVYLGKIGNVSEKNQGQRVVTQLTEFWGGSKRAVTTGNFFTDITLAETLLEKKIYLIGTMRKNRKDLPKSLINVKSREIHSSTFLFTPKVTLVSYIPKPRKCVVLLSALHNQNSISGPADKYKPDIIKYYNKTKSGVDVLDKLVREYCCRRCTRRWPLSLFLNFLDIAAYNAMVIWMTKNPTWEANIGMKKKRKLFLEKLGNELYTANIERRAAAYENREISLPKHVLSAIEATGRIIKKNPLPTEARKRSRCYLCTGNDNKYSAKCDECSQHICNTHAHIKTNVLCANCIQL